MQPFDERRNRDLRRETRNHVRVRAATGDFAQKFDQLVRDGNLSELERPLHHRHIGVETLGGEQGASRRAGDADNPIDRNALPGHDSGELLQVLRARTVIFEQLDAGCHRLAADPRQQFGDQSAARMREQMKPRAFWRGFGQRDGVGDRACAKRRVVERIHPVLKPLEELIDELRVFAPQLSERPGGFAEGPVNQHQRWCFARCDRGRRPVLD